MRTIVSNTGLIIHLVEADALDLLNLAKVLISARLALDELFEK